MPKTMAHRKYLILVCKYFIIARVGQNGFEFSTNHILFNSIHIISKTCHGQPKFRQLLATPPRPASHQCSSLRMLVLTMGKMNLREDQECF